MGKNRYKKFFPYLWYGLITLALMVVYDIFLKPTGPVLRDFFLNLTSLWIESIKDNTYHAIAKGFHEQTSLLTYSLLSFLFFVFILTTSLVLLFTVRLTRKKVLNLMGETLKVGKIIETIEASDKESEVTDEIHPGEQKLVELIGDYKSVLQKGSWVVKSSKGLVPAVYVMIIFVVVCFVISVIKDKRLRYINSAITHYQQVLRISEPFLSDIDKKRIISSFAQIRNKTDYVSHIKKLEDIAKKNEQYVPKFEAW